MSDEPQKRITPICPHCGEFAQPLGLCKNCQNPVCEHCGRKVKDKVEHLPDWCWSISTPTRRD